MQVNKRNSTSKSNLIKNKSPPLVSNLQNKKKGNPTSTKKTKKNTNLYQSDHTMNQ